MAKYFVKANVYGVGGAIVRKAGTTVTLKDDVVVDPVLFERVEEIADEQPKTLEVATPKRSKALDE